MNILDSTIVSYVNSLHRQSMLLDHFIGFLAHSPLLKGGVLATIIWWLWFRAGQSRREILISTVFICILGIALARALAALLPFRFRPMHEPGLGFIPPYGLELEILDGWSSFPSDHAVLFFTLSTGILFLSRRVGALALVYTAVVIGFPRVYLGLHYPTDVIAGAVIGMGIGWAGNLYIERNGLFQSIFRWLDSKPGVFYPFFFLMTYQIADLFSSSRGLLRGVRKLLQIMLD